MLKRLLILLAAGLIAAPAAATPWGDFQNRVTSANLKPFALDVGGLLGGAAFHSGRSLGFPGFDAGVVAMAQFRADREDTVLRGSGNLLLPMAQAEVGLPLRTDVIAHGMSLGGARVLGGGLRWGVLRSGALLRIPDVSVSAFADGVTHPNFSAQHYSVNASASWNLPVLHPYAGVGYDITRVKVGSAAVPGLGGTSAWARGTRLTGGLDFSPLPLVHVFAAYSLRHGLPGADFGVGARF